MSYIIEIEDYRRRGSTCAGILGGRPLALVEEKSKLPESRPA